MQTVQSHLTPEVLHRRGQPDTTLMLGNSRFQVHRSYVSACSGVLSNLLSDFQGAGDLRLLADGGPAANTSAAAAASSGSVAPPAIASEQHFELFLRHVYGGTALISSEEQALALLSHADYWDCPLVLPAADAFLANAVQAGELGVCEVSATTMWVTKSMRNEECFYCIRDDAKLAQYLVLASRHKLRRLTAVCLPLMPSMAAWEQTIQKLDQAVQHALLVAMLKQATPDRCSQGSCDGHAHKSDLPYSCRPSRHGSTCCKKCKQAQHLDWCVWSERLEKALLVAGWGCP